MQGRCSPTAAYRTITWSLQNPHDIFPPDLGLPLTTLWVTNSERVLPGRPSPIHVASAVQLGKLRNCTTIQKTSKSVSCSQARGLGVPCHGSLSLLIPPSRLSKSQHRDLWGSTHLTRLAGFDEARNGICQTSPGSIRNDTRSLSAHVTSQNRGLALQTEENGETNANPRWEDGKATLQARSCCRLGKTGSATHAFDI